MHRHSLRASTRVAAGRRSPSIPRLGHCSLLCGPLARWPQLVAALELPSNVAARCATERRFSSGARTKVGDDDSKAFRELVTNTAAEHAQLRKLLESASEERAELREQMSAQERRTKALAADLREFVELLRSESVAYRSRVQRKGVRGRGAQSRMSYRPSVEYAERQPTHVCEMGHVSLAELAMKGNHSAQRERLLREIMAVDQVSWGEAHKVLEKFDIYNERYYWAESLPYRVGFTTALAAAVVSCLLVFWKPLAAKYGTDVAGEALPEGLEEMSVNQVGTWTWSWMEPMIGTASFALLCCQFGRVQVAKMNMKPYGLSILQWRANRLAREFPDYDRSIVRAWAKRMPRVGLNLMPIYERDVGMKGPTSGL